MASLGPGWDCEQCGNHNFENRTSCNMRKCNAPRPGFEDAGPICPPAKMQRVAGGGAVGVAGGAAATTGAGENWTCEKCGNLNYANRTYCNKRTCGAPGPWNCPSCGNRNYAGRNTCNMKRCQQPRPPPTSLPGKQGLQVQQAMASQALSMLQASGIMANPGVAESLQHIANVTGVALNVAPAAPQRAQGPLPKGLPTPSIANNGAGRQQQPVQEDSWMCIECNNINFPNRTTCNKRSCGKPREEVDAGPPPPDMMNGGGGALGGGAMAFEVPVAGAAKQQQPIQEGSWICIECNNINFPNRDTCNKRTCGKPRYEVDGGPPPADALVPMSTPRAPEKPSHLTQKPGSWICGQCNNVNWPERSTCGMRKCALPRDQCDAGPPP